jgi:hypothetical protein
MLCGGNVDTTKSPNARLHPVPLTAVRMTSGFWSGRMAVSVSRSIPRFLSGLEEHGAIDNFRRLTGRKSVERRGELFSDSDIYKWIEAAAIASQSGGATDFAGLIEAVVGEIVAVQEPSGYLNTYYVGNRRSLRFQEMHRSHELYCLGHMLQAGIACFRAFGAAALLEAGIRFADYLVRDFGPTKQPLLTGCPELEMALVELFRVTGERRYIELAGYLLSGVERERLGLTKEQIRYMFSGVPFTSRTEFEGHAVRALYAACGATDYWLETGDTAYGATLERLWRDLTSSKMYITGGVGSRAEDEAFGEAYELPNRTAYCESCAAIANVMWNWRMLLATGEARFADIMERALYNNVNAGMSLDGTLYCYRNPLQLAGWETPVRNPWYQTTCCPPNLQRTFVSLPGYLYSTSADELWVHFYHGSRLDVRLESRERLELEQKTDYPNGGRVELILRPEKPLEFALYLRIPAWSRDAHVSVNDGLIEAEPGTYLRIGRVWRPGDSITLDLNVEPRLTEANPRVRENHGKVAVEAGPIVYCMEQVDHPDGPIFDTTLSVAEPEPVCFDRAIGPESLGGMPVFSHRGLVIAHPLDAEGLYRPWGDFSRIGLKDTRVKLIPYFAYANRGHAAMQIWIRMTRNDSM